MHLKDYVKVNLDTKTYIRIKVTPRQKSCEFYWIMSDWTIKIRLKSVPEKWRANEELISFIKKELSLKNEVIEIISWASDSIKLIRIN